MGSMDDQELAKRYLKGHRQVIFCHNSSEAKTWEEIFKSLAAGKGLRPITYSGAGRSIRPEPPARSNIDNELRDDFFQSAARIVYLGRPPSGNFNDHWALQELPEAGERVLILCSPEFPRSVLSSWTSVEPKVVSSVDEFAAAVHAYLAA